MTPYQYVNNNPINLIDPTGMSAEGLDHDPPKEKAKGEKVLHIKYQGRDVSIYENDDNILARGYRAFKEIRKNSDEFLSGGFHFDDNDNKPKGDQSLRKNPMEGQKVQRKDVSGLMQGGSFAKSMDGTRFKLGANKDETAKITNSVITGFNLGQSIPDSKVQIPTNFDYSYEGFYNGFSQVIYQTATGQYKDTVVPISKAPQTIQNLRRKHEKTK